MSRYIIGRIGQALLVLWIAFTASFLLLQALPGDAILIKFQNPELGLGPEQIAALRDAYGVDSPLWQQYLQALGNFLTGNFGYSVVGSVPVAHELLANLPATARLASLGFTLAVLIALGLAFLATLAPFAWLRTAIQSIPSLFVSLPVFWLGIMLIQIFSFRLRWISVINPGEFEGLILPVITLAIPISAPLAQILIRNIDEVSTQPFVAVARAKGASPSWVLWRHVVKNALLPTLTIAGILFGELLAGAVITETVFGLNGIGGLTERSVRFQDTSVIQAIVVFSALSFVAVNLIVDLLYPVFDPRLRRLKGAPA
ncbi:MULTISPECIES: ABC transporter permease [unclassified Devosia]|uniref:ABC transporter permease n=1 Tax=unclassified Devosia TaxID=196773 RepID=UPI00086D51F1|nr:MULTISPECIES: ABC transporter permease [unclassified Devosia]MBN9363447.1 ABC transporter permease [Devosia sp.]ODS82629.1 MAG: peptide ABC transporter permease [Devosia sp. SCN 66-27]OJX25267.1 MAG: peptide ABC transporter permease [Devosia sp. 66-14]